MKPRIFLGIDTSNYTTSVAAVSEDGEILANVKHLLPVKDGECGLRQSDALFFHTQRLPDCFAEFRSVVGDATVVAVGVSDRPRNVEGSYMPCFLAGVSAASAVSTAVGCKMYRFSHQCGHLMAAIQSSGRTEFFTRPFGAFHVSGGTTELLRASFDGTSFTTECIGGTRDLNAGQAIDRIGVMLGLQFPCGAELEKLAVSNQKPIPKPKISVDGTYVNLSGLQNLAEKLYNETNDAPLVAAYTLRFISESLGAMSAAYIEKYGESPILYAGGVISDALIKRYLSERFDAAFAEPRLSSDNAVGVAYLARRSYQSEVE